MNVLILAGGLGTRLKSAIGDLPKPIAPVNGNPFLYYLLKNLEQYPVEHVCLSLGYGADQIKDALKSYNFTFDVSFAIEPSPLGTGGGIYYAMQTADFDEAIILNGDTFFNIDLTNFYAFFKQTQCDIAIASRFVDDAGRYGALQVQNENVIAFHEKSQQGAGLINAGIYCICFSIFKNIEKNNSFSFEIFMKNHLDKLIIKSKEYTLPFIDIGIPEDYNCAHEIVKLYIAQ